MTTKTNRTKPNARERFDVLDFLIAEDSIASDPDPSVGKWAVDQAQQRQAENNKLRRERTPEAAPVRKAPPIRSSTLELSRELLEAGIARFSRSAGVAQYAHRSLKGLSDNDLRRIYDTLDPDRHTNQNG